MKRDGKSYIEAAEMFEKIYARYGTNPFTWDDISDLITKIRLRFSFRDLRLSGVIYTIKRGKYHITRLPDRAELVSIMKQIANENNAKNRRRIKLEKELAEIGKTPMIFSVEPTAAPPVAPPAIPTIEFMINYLKSQGYKIMKPIQQYEEI